MKRRRSLILLALLACAGAAGAEERRFDPIDFFTGHSTGDGRLKVLFRQAKRVDVESHGVMGKDGWLNLTQEIREQGKKPRTRTWRFHAVGTGHYEGTLSDAVGPVTIAVDGKRATIRYRDKKGFGVEQELTLQSPALVRNEMRITRFFIPVAHLTETIRKLD